MRKENNTTYDCVLVCRFDLGNHSEISKLHFNPSNDMNFIYAKWWNQLENGMPEQWLYSNSATIDTLEKLYSRYFTWFQPDSEYYKILSSWNIEKQYAANNHVIYRYFFTEQNLYDKIVFLKS